MPGRVETGTVHPGSDAGKGLNDLRISSPSAPLGARWAQLP